MRSLLMTLALLTMSAQAVAMEISIGLIDDNIAVDAGFAGAKLTLFGAVTGIENPADNIDIIAVIRGPTENFTLRPLEKRGLIWMSGATHKIENAPGLYLSAATRAVADIAPLPHQSDLVLLTDFIAVSAPVIVDGAPALSSEIIRAAFLTEAEELGLYRNNAGEISFKKGALFTIKTELPANTPVGVYDVNVYLYRDGEIIGRDSASLAVNKVGVERRIYELAHNQPIAYGIFCVALSLFAGWIAGLAFRK